MNLFYKAYNKIKHSVMWFYKKLWGKAVRICVFQMGEFGRFSFWRRVIQIYEKRAVIRKKQMDYFLYILEEIGGERRKKLSEDGNAVIEFMLFRFDALKEKIHDNGGKLRSVAINRLSDHESLYQIADEGTKATVIYRDQDKYSEEWDLFFNQILKELGWDLIALVDENGHRKQAYMTLGNPNIDRYPRQVFLRCHSPGRSYPMEILYIGSHLGIGCDVCVFDYRGTYHSSGTPSEGGYYLDAESIFKELLDHYRYHPKSIWITGFCLGAAVGAYIKAKYAHLPVNFVAENPFTSVKKLIMAQNKVAGILGQYGLPAIEDKNKEVLKRVHQDYFNMEEKFQHIARAPHVAKCKIIIADMEHDKIVPKDSANRLFELAGTFSDAYHIVHNKGAGSSTEAHMERPLENPPTWEKYVQIIFTIEPLEEKTFYT